MPGFEPFLLCDFHIHTLSRTASSAYVRYAISTARPAMSTSSRSPITS